MLGSLPSPLNIRLGRKLIGCYDMAAITSINCSIEQASCVLGSSCTGTLARP